MFKSNTAKLILFSLMILGHMYMYDPSLELFFTNLLNVLKLNFNDKSLLSTVTWVMGFAGMVLFLNHKNNIIKVVSWLVFMLTATIEFLYTKILHDSFGLDNVHSISRVFHQVQSINSIELAKFVGITITIVAISVVVCSLSLNTNKVFISILMALIVLLIIATRGVNVALPSFYLIPILVMYKYTLSACSIELSKPTSVH